MLPHLPEYGPLDPAAEINTLGSADLEQQLHGPHVKLDLERHPKASLNNHNISF
jgi:hypothetical protein